MSFNSFHTHAESHYKSHYIIPLHLYHTISVNKCSENFKNGCFLQSSGESLGKKLIYHNINIYA